MAKSRACRSKTPLVRSHVGSGNSVAQGNVFKTLTPLLPSKGGATNLTQRRSHGSVEQFSLAEIVLISPWNIPEANSLLRECFMKLV